MNVRNITAFNELMESDRFVVRFIAHLLAPLIYPWLFLEAIFSCTDDEMQDRWGHVSSVLEEFLFMPMYVVVFSFLVFVTISMLFIAVLGYYDIHLTSVIGYIPFIYISGKIFTFYFRDI